MKLNDDIDIVVLIDTRLYFKQPVSHFIQRQAQLTIDVECGHLQGMFENIIIRRMQEKFGKEASHGE